MDEIQVACKTEGIAEIVVREAQQAISEIHKSFLTSGYN